LCSCGHGSAFGLQKFSGSESEIVTRSGCIEIAVIKPDRLRGIRRRFEYDTRYRVVTAKVAQLDCGVVAVICFEKQRIAFGARVELDNQIAFWRVGRLVPRCVAEFGCKFVTALVSDLFRQSHLPMEQR